VTHLPPPSVRIIACGNADRGDDGVAVAALATLLPELPREVQAKLEIRRSDELRVEDVEDLPDGAACLVVDAVLGPPPGTVVRCSLGELGADPSCTPHSSHQLPADIVLGLAAVLRGRAIPGRFVGVAGHAFGYGSPLTRVVRAALPEFRGAIDAEIRSLVEAQDVMATPVHRTEP
jgi:hydrogenase maturation protease